MSEHHYKANFLWPHEKESIEEAGYEFANGQTESYQKVWWDILIERLKNSKETKRSSETDASEKR